MRSILIAVACLFFSIASQISGTAQAQGLDHNRVRGIIAVPETPIEVAIGIEIEQITSVDQKSENYGAVSTIRMEWHEPLLAFETDGGKESAKVFKPDAFIEYVWDKSIIVPTFSIQNQQGNRWTQNELVIVHPDGRVRYLEKSSLTLQAPYFNFTRYPFDRQTFFFEIVSHFSTDVVRYVPLEGLSGLGKLLGEEEWILENDELVIGEARGITGETSPNAALKFDGRRHSQYYLTRIFLPMLVLVVVSWSVFFLDGYRKRAEAAGANLLVFVAFNWVISDELPKLGYLTFLDFILQWVFVVTGLIIVINVFLSRLKATGREHTAIFLDSYVFRWVYPIGYVGIVFFGIWHYLLNN